MDGRPDNKMPPSTTYFFSFDQLPCYLVPSLSLITENRTGFKTFLQDLFLSAVGSSLRVSALYSTQCTEHGHVFYVSLSWSSSFLSQPLLYETKCTTRNWKQSFQLALFTPVFLRSLRCSSPQPVGQFDATNTDPVCAVNNGNERKCLT